MNTPVSEARPATVWPMKPKYSPVWRKRIVPLMRWAAGDWSNVTASTTAPVVRSSVRVCRKVGWPPLPRSDEHRYLGLSGARQGDGDFAPVRGILRCDTRKSVERQHARRGSDIEPAITSCLGRASTSPSALHVASPLGRDALGALNAQNGVDHVAGPAEREDGARHDEDNEGNGHPDPEDMVPVVVPQPARCRLACDQQAGP